MGELFIQTSALLPRFLYQNPLYRPSSIGILSPYSAPRYRQIGIVLPPQLHQAITKSTPKRSSCARRPLVIHATRPPGGAVVNTLPASWKQFLQSNGAPARHESNNKDTNTRRWAVFHRRD